jgi:LmbE family N-acetylglucosaminyl deacetylase
MVLPNGSAFPAGSRIAVLAPHLDDAALSLGGTIARASRSGNKVTIVTVFAYDPAQSGPPQAWDAACGFGSAEEAARVRRDEDASACKILGAEPVWLPFADVEYEADHDENRVWEAIADAVGNADLVLTPGFPLAAPDHAWLTQLLLRRPLENRRLGFYVEQPYAAWRQMGRGGRTGAEALSVWRGLTNAFRITLRTPGARKLQQPRLETDFASLLPAPPRWVAAPFAGDERRAKFRAIDAYRSQVDGFGPLVLRRIALYEAAWGGEGLAWVSDGEVTISEHGRERRATE